MPESERLLSKPVGYQALQQQFKLRPCPQWRIHSAHPRSHKQIEQLPDGQEIVRIPQGSAPSDDLLGQLMFALKHEGVNLCLLSQLFGQIIDSNTVASWIIRMPTSRYVRRLWFLYEWLTGQHVPVADLHQGNYIPVLDPRRYYTIPGRKLRRYRIIDNLPGTVDFCPLIRRTPRLEGFDQKAFVQQCQKIIDRYPTQMMRRALSWLFTRETKSSFAIESISPSTDRTERFIALLQLAETEDFCHREGLIELQNRIVDPRYASRGWRSSQNYVGQTHIRGEQVHYIPPPPDQVDEMMTGLIESHRRMEAHLPILPHAAAISFGFVFIHPFEDGNGRIHRFLLHNIFARRGLVPSGMVFPISAAMHRHQREYDALLERFSRPLMLTLDYHLDEEGRLEVTKPFEDYYRFPDLTAQAEGLIWFMEQTLHRELTEELDFLHRHDQARKQLQSIIDMPDRKLDLFIRLCIQNGGRIATRKRSLFSELSDDELRQLEKIVRNQFKLETGA